MVAEPPYTGRAVAVVPSLAIGGMVAAIYLNDGFQVRKIEVGKVNPSSCLNGLLGNHPQAHIRQYAVSGFFCIRATKEQILSSLLYPFPAIVLFVE